MEWPEVDDGLEREFEFESFPAAIAFVDRLAEVAEAANHHPDIDIRWRKVRIALTTHDAGGLTDLDFRLATETEACLT
jgi:4a-hydroxytetrahydrobiopterin dehydratase